MSDFTNELLRLSEMREKGLISQEEFEAAKARLFGNAETPANETPSPPELPETREAATVVMSVVPPESPQPAAKAAMQARVAIVDTRSARMVPPGPDGGS